MRSLFKFVRGVAVGAFGSWMIGKVRSRLDERQGERTREIEDTRRHPRARSKVAANFVFLCSATTSKPTTPR